MPLLEGAVSLLLSCHNTPVFFTSCRVISRLGTKVFASCGIQTYQNWFLTTKFYVTYENFWQMTPKGNITHTAYRWFCKFSRKCNNTWHDVFFICCLNIVEIDFRIVWQWFFLINSWLLQHEKSVSGYDDTPKKRKNCGLSDHWVKSFWCHCQVVVIITSLSGQTNQLTRTKHVNKS